MCAHNQTTQHFMYVIRKLHSDLHNDLRLMFWVSRRCGNENMENVPKHRSALVIYNLNSFILVNFINRYRCTNILSNKLYNMKLILIPVITPLPFLSFIDHHVKFYCCVPSCACIPIFFCSPTMYVFTCLPEHIQE